MNDLRRGCVCGSLSIYPRLSHLYRSFYKTETRNLKTWNTRTTTTHTGTVFLLRQRNFAHSSAKMTRDTKKWTASVVRKTFLDFFENKGHTFGKFGGVAFFWKSLQAQYQQLRAAQWSMALQFFWSMVPMELLANVCEM